MNVKPRAALEAAAGLFICRSVRVSRGGVGTRGRIGLKTCFLSQRRRQRTPSFLPWVVLSTTVWHGLFWGIPGVRFHPQLRDFCEEGLRGQVAARERVAA